MSYMVKNNFNLYYFIIMLFINIILIIISNYNYLDYYKVYGYEENDFVIINIDYDQYHNILGKKLNINKTYYDYQISETKDIVINNIVYKETKITINNYIYIKDKITSLNFISEETNIIKEISEFLKKGIIGWKN